MGFDVGFSNLGAEIAHMPTSVIIGGTRGIRHPSQPAAALGLHSVAFDPVEVLNDGPPPSRDFAGVETVTPELFFNVSIGFRVLVGRFPQLDTYGYGPETIASAAANLSIGNMSATRQNVHAFHVPAPSGSSPPAGGYFGGVSNNDGDAFWVGYIETDTNPETIQLSLGLFGARWDVTAGQFVFDALGGGGTSFSATVQNNHVPTQTVAVDATGLVKTYLLNKNAYEAFVWVVVPANNVEQVSEITSPEDVTAALWGMYAQGDFAWVNLGDGIGHPGDPYYALYNLEGEVTTLNMEFDGLSLGPINVKLTGDLALPDDCRIGPYGVPMNPLA